MKRKIFVGIFVLLVSILVLMANVLGSGGPPAWLNQTTLSTVDNQISRDPENSGYGPIQAAVWEEFNRQNNDWDIYMTFSLNNGLAWVAPIAVAATANVDEINPAVTVTNTHPITGVTEIHVVYQRWNAAGGGQWDVCHIWTNNWGVGWTGPSVRDTLATNDAIDPAIVFTEDLNFPGPVRGWLVQFVWSEWNPGAIPARYEIQYDAHYYNPGLPRVYVGSTLIRTTAVGDCLYPEIASVDEVINGAAYDYYFSVVWQEPVNFPPLQITVYYHDGTTQITPGPPTTTPNPGGAGLISPFNPGGDCYHPDIAATWDYAIVGATYYFHVDWVFQAPGPPITYQIDTCYQAAVIPIPGPIGFVATPSARGPINTVLNNPTIASKLISFAPLTYEIWMGWEDSNNPASAPDIWYSVGAYTPGGGPPPFAYTFGPAPVPYVQPGAGSEFNPELWNRNDLWIGIPLTHLVFDMPNLINGVRDIEYIDP